MQVTLKKASDLSRAALEVANGSIRPRLDAVLSVYQKAPVGDTVEKARLAALEEEMGAMLLIKVAFSIRKSIGIVNASAGIDDALTERAMLDVMERRMQSMVSTVGFDDEAIDTVAARLEAAKQRVAAGDSLSRFEESFTTPVLGKEDIARINSDLATLKRRKNDLKDEVAGLNLTNYIKLTDDQVKVLRTFQILG